MSGVNKESQLISFNIPKHFFLFYFKFFLLLNVFSPNLEASETRKLEKAEKYFTEGEFDKTVQISDEIILKNPQQLDAYTAKIKALVMQDKFLVAKETYDQLLQANTGDHPPSLTALSWGIIKESLTDRSFFVRGSAASALGEVGDERAVKPLETLLKDDFDIVKVRAIEALGTLNRPEALPILRPLVEDKRYLVRSAAVESLGKLGDKSHLLGVYKDLIDRSWTVRARAAVVLGNLAVPEASVHLRKKIKDENQFVRVRVAEALAKCGDTGVRQIFVDTARTGEWPDRVRAARSLLDLEERELAFEVLGQALHQKDWKVRVQAAEVLGQSGDQKALSLLEKNLKDSRWEVQFAVAKALVELKDLSAVSHLRKLLDADDADVRANAAGTFGRAGDSNDFLYLRQALKDSDGRVRVQAAKSIIQIRHRKEFTDAIKSQP